MFRDYEFGWARILYDGAVFHVTKIGQACIEKKFQRYKLIGDVAYLVRPWMYYLFKCEKGASLGKKKTINLSSFQPMCLERAFSILKSK